MANEVEENREKDFADVVQALRAAPRVVAPADFTARVMAAVRAERAAARRRFSASLLLPLAASLVALLAVAGIFFRDVPSFEESRATSRALAPVALHQAGDVSPLRAVAVRIVTPLRAAWADLVAYCSGASR